MELDNISQDSSIEERRKFTEELLKSNSTSNQQELLSAQADSQTDDLTVLSEIQVTNFELLRLLRDGGVMDSKGQLFSIRVVRTWDGKTKTGRPMWGLAVQVVTKGMNNYVKREAVRVQVKKEKVIVKKESNKPEYEPLPEAVNEGEAGF